MVQFQGGKEGDQACPQKIFKIDSMEHIWVQVPSYNSSTSCNVMPSLKATACDERVILLPDLHPIDPKYILQAASKISLLHWACLNLNHPAHRHTINSTLQEYVMLFPTEQSCFIAGKNSAVHASQESQCKLHQRHQKIMPRRIHLCKLRNVPEFMLPSLTHEQKASINFVQGPINSQSFYTGEHTTEVRLPCAPTTRNQMCGPASSLPLLLECS